MTHSRRPRHQRPPRAAAPKSTRRPAAPAPVPMLQPMPQPAHIPDRPPPGLGRSVDFEEALAVFLAAELHGGCFQHCDSVLLDEWERVSTRLALHLHGLPKLHPKALVTQFVVSLRRYIAFRALKEFLAASGKWDAARQVPLLGDGDGALWTWYLVWNPGAVEFKHKTFVAFQAYDSLCAPAYEQAKTSLQPLCEFDRLGEADCSMLFTGNFQWSAPRDRCLIECIQTVLDMPATSTSPTGAKAQLTATMWKTVVELFRQRQECGAVSSSELQRRLSFLRQCTTSFADMKCVLTRHGMWDSIEELPCGSFIYWEWYIVWNPQMRPFRTMTFELFAPMTKLCDRLMPFGGRPESSVVPAKAVEAATPAVPRTLKNQRVAGSVFTSTRDIVEITNACTEENTAYATYDASGQEGNKSPYIEIIKEAEPSQLKTAYCAFEWNATHDEALITMIRTTVKTRKFGRFDSISRLEWMEINAQFSAHAKVTFSHKTYQLERHFATMVRKYVAFRAMKEFFVATGKWDNNRQLPDQAPETKSLWNWYITWNPLASDFTTTTFYPYAPYDQLCFPAFQSARLSHLPVCEYSPSDAPRYTATKITWDTDMDESLLRCVYAVLKENGAPENLYEPHFTCAMWEAVTEEYNRHHSRKIVNVSGQTLQKRFAHLRRMFLEFDKMNRYFEEQGLWNYERSRPAYLTRKRWEHYVMWHAEVESYRTTAFTLADSFKRMCSQLTRYEKVSMDQMVDEAAAELARGGRREPSDRQLEHQSSHDCSDAQQEVVEQKQKEIPIQVFGQVSFNDPSQVSQCLTRALEAVTCPSAFDRFSDYFKHLDAQISQTKQKRARMPSNDMDPSQGKIDVKRASSPSILRLGKKHRKTCDQKLNHAAEQLSGPRVHQMTVSNIEDWNSLRDKALISCIVAVIGDRKIGDYNCVRRHEWKKIEEKFVATTEWTSANETGILVTECRFVEMIQKYISFRAMKEFFQACDRWSDQALLPALGSDNDRMWKWYLLWNPLASEFATKPFEMFQTYDQLCHGMYDDFKAGYFPMCQFQGASSDSLRGHHWDQEHDEALISCLKFAFGVEDVDIPPSATFRISNEVWNVTFEQFGRWCQLTKRPVVNSWELQEKMADLWRLYRILGVFLKYFSWNLTNDQFARLGNPDVHVFLRWNPEAYKIFSGTFLLDREFIKLCAHMAPFTGTDALAISETKTPLPKKNNGSERSSLPVASPRASTKLTSERSMSADLLSKSRALQSLARKQALDRLAARSKMLSPTNSMDWTDEHLTWLVQCIRESYDELEIEDFQTIHGSTWKNVAKEFSKRHFPSHESAMQSFSPSVLEKRFTEAIHKYVSFCAMKEFFTLCGVWNSESATPKLTPDKQYMWDWYLLWNPLAKEFLTTPFALYQECNEICRRLYVRTKAALQPVVEFSQHQGSPRRSTSLPLEFLWTTEQDESLIECIDLAMKTASGNSSSQLCLMCPTWEIVVDEFHQRTMLELGSWELQRRLAELRRGYFAWRDMRATFDAMGLWNHDQNTPQVKKSVWSRYLSWNPAVANDFRPTHRQLSDVCGRLTPFDPTTLDPSIHNTFPAARRESREPAIQTSESVANERRIESTVTVVPTGDSEKTKSRTQTHRNVNHRPSAPPADVEVIEIKEEDSDDDNSFGATPLTPSNSSQSSMVVDKRETHAAVEHFTATFEDMFSARDGVRFCMHIGTSEELAGVFNRLGFAQQKYMIQAVLDSNMDVAYGNV